MHSLLQSRSKVQMSQPSTKGTMPYHYNWVVWADSLPFIEYNISSLMWYSDNFIGFVWSSYMSLTKKLLTYRHDGEEAIQL